MSTSVPELLRREPSPRVELVPDGIVGSFGAEAVELARLSGLELDYWQQQAVELMLSFRADGKWACRQYCEWVARQNGKGAILETRALAGLFLLGEELIMWSAHEVKTAQEGFRRMRTRLATMGREYERRGAEYIAIEFGDELFTVKIVQTNGKEGFEILETKQRLMFVARSKSSGRGFSGDCNIIDESFAYTFFQQEALGPTMRARPNPQTIYTSTPPLDGMSGPVMYRLRKRAESDNPGRLGYRDWGAGGYLEDLEELTPQALAEFLDDVERWANTNPALGVRVTDEAMRDDRDEMSELGFAREIFCVWPKQVGVDGNGTIDPDTWELRKDATSQLVGKVRFAVDVDPERKRSTICVAGRRADGKFHVERIRGDAGTGWVVAALKKLVAAWDCGPVLLDPRAAAGALIQALEEAGIEVEQITTAELGQATGEFIDLVANDLLRHLGQEALTTAVLGGQLRPIGDSYAWARKDVSVDITSLVAATLALHGAAAAPEPESPDPWVLTEDDWEDSDVEDEDVSAFA